MQRNDKIKSTLTDLNSDKEKNRQNYNYLKTVDYIICYKMQVHKTILEIIKIYLYIYRQNTVLYT